MLIESVECRRMLSCCTLDGDTLTVVGTKRSDSISISVSGLMSGAGTSVTMNDKEVLRTDPNSPNAVPRRIIVLGGKGADRIEVHQTFNEDNTAVTIRAGAGNDHVTLSAEYGFRAKVWGDAGNDVIEAGDALYRSPWTQPLELRGGAGDDVVRMHSGGEPGYELAATVVKGGPGKDLLVAGAAHDVLEGGPGADTLRGGDGNDRLVGGAGPDELDGGTGNNALVQGGGKWEESTLGPPRLGMDQSLDGGAWRECAD